MNLITNFSRFPDQEACIEHLEAVRFGDRPYCPLCGGVKVARKADGQRVGRWNCHDCYASFNVLSGTVFAKTRIPLQKWFLAIGIIVNAKKSVSSCQLARDLDMTQPIGLYMQHRIRAAMASTQGRCSRGSLRQMKPTSAGSPESTTRAMTTLRRRTSVAGHEENPGDRCGRARRECSGQRFHAAPGEGHPPVHPSER